MTTLYCSVCDKPSSFRCARCISVQYCSKKCQREDWAEHKAPCKEAGELKKDFFPHKSIEETDVELKKMFDGADEGNSNDLYNTGLLFARGLGVPVNKHEAFNQYKKASELGNINASINLGAAYGNGDGVQVDFEKSYKEYHKCALMGDELAQHNLAHQLFKGEGCARNTKKALEWF